MALPVMAAAALAGRLLLAAIFLHEAWSKLTGYSAALAYMQAFGVPGQLLPLAIAVEVGCGVLILCGYHTRAAALLLAGFCLVTAALFHTKFGDRNQLLHFWSGPKSMRFTDATGKSVVASGYERKPGQSVAVVAPVADVSGDLPARLEAVTRLASREVGKVLKAPFDASNGVLTRNKVTADGIAVNAQLRADQQRLRTKQTG